MKTFFPLTYRHVRITDILGLDELLTVRGLKEVAVVHVQSKSTNLTVETDRANLSELLAHQLKKDKVCLPKKQKRKKGDCSSDADNQKGYDPLEEF
jgi:hypothetical protein